MASPLDVESARDPPEDQDHQREGAAAAMATLNHEAVRFEGAVEDVRRDGRVARDLQGAPRVRGDDAAHALSVAPAPRAVHCAHDDSYGCLSRS